MFFIFLLLIDYQLKTAFFTCETVAVSARSYRLLGLECTTERFLNACWPCGTLTIVSQLQALIRTVVYQLAGSGKVSLPIALPWLVSKRALGDTGAVRVCWDLISYLYLTVGQSARAEICGSNNARWILSVENFLVMPQCSLEQLCERLLAPKWLPGCRLIMLDLDSSHSWLLNCITAASRVAQLGELRLKFNCSSAQPWWIQWNTLSRYWVGSRWGTRV